MTDTFEPVIGYHGSYKEITRFSQLRYEGVGGIYFTFDLDDAWIYANNGCIEQGDIPTVMTANLRINSPFRMYGIASQELTTDRIAELKRLGHDAVFGVSNSNGQVHEIAVFDPEQIEIVAVEKRIEPGFDSPRM